MTRATDAIRARLAANGDERVILRNYNPDEDLDITQFVEDLLRVAEAAEAYLTATEDANIDQDGPAWDKADAAGDAIRAALDGER